MSLKRKSYPLLNGLRTTAWKLTWQKHKDKANGGKYGRYVYPNILEAFENKRYDRIWKGPFIRKISYYFLRPMRKHLTSSPYITAKQTPLCTCFTLFCNVTARKFPNFNFHGGSKKKANNFLFNLFLDLGTVLLIQENSPTFFKIQFRDGIIAMKFEQREFTFLKRRCSVSGDGTETW